MILPEAGHYGGEVLSDHIAVHVEDLLGQEEKLIMALRVLETLKILARSLSEGRVVSHAILDRRVDPTGLSVEVVVRGGGGVVGGLGPGGDRLHHDEPPTTLWVITALSQDELTSLTTRKHSEIFLRLNCKGNHPGLLYLCYFLFYFDSRYFLLVCWPVVFLEIFPIWTELSARSAVLVGVVCDGSLLTRLGPLLATAAVWLGLPVHWESHHCTVTTTTTVIISQALQPTKYIFIFIQTNLFLYKQPFCHGKVTVIWCKIKDTTSELPNNLFLAPYILR